MLVLSIKFGPTKSGNKRAKQWDVRNLTMNTESFRISNCEAEDRSDCHCTGVAIAELGWDRTHTNTHTPHTHTIHTHHKHTHSTHAHHTHTHTTNTHTAHTHTIHTPQTHTCTPYTHTHTAHSMPLLAQTQTRPICELCQVLHLPNPSTIFMHFSRVRSVSYVLA